MIDTIGTDSDDGLIVTDVVADVVDATEAVVDVPQGVATGLQAGQGDDLGENASKTTKPTRIQGNSGFGTLTPIRSPARAAELSNIRWSRYRKVSEAGMVAGILGENVPVTLAAKLSSFARIVQAQAEAAITLSDNGTANTAAARFVRESIGADIGSPKRGASDDVSVDEVRISIGGDVAVDIARILAGVLAGRGGR